jgi:hypothetical protein
VKELTLSAILSDGRTVLLRADNVVQAAFESADLELIAALFQGGTSREALRRAFWLGRIRRSPEITVAQLARLVKKVGSMTSVEKTLYFTPPTTFRQHLRAFWL